MNPDVAFAYECGAKGKENAGHLATGNVKDELQKRRRWGKKDPVTDGVGGHKEADPSQLCASGDDQIMMSQPPTNDSWKKNAMTTQTSSDGMPDEAKSNGLARASGTSPIEKEVRKIQKALREIDALEQRFKAGEKLLQNQQWKIKKKATLVQRICELGVQA